MTTNLIATPIGWVLTFAVVATLFCLGWTTATRMLQAFYYRARVRQRATRNAEDVFWRQHRADDAELARRLRFARYQHTLEAEGGHHSLQVVS